MLNEGVSYTVQNICLFHFISAPGHSIDPAWLSHIWSLAFWSGIFSSMSCMYSFPPSIMWSFCTNREPSTSFRCKQYLLKGGIYYNQADFVQGAARIVTCRTPLLNSHLLNWCKLWAKEFISRLILVIFVSGKHTICQLVLIIDLSPYEE